MAETKQVYNRLKVHIQKPRDGSPGVALCMGVPIGPLFIGECVTVIGIEHLPERRTEYPFTIQDGETEIILVDDLMGYVINTDFALDTLDHDEHRQQRFTDNIEVLGKAAKGNVHIVKGLREHINRDTIVTMIFEPLDSRFRKGFIVPVVEFDTGLINDHLAVLYHENTNVSFSIEGEGAIDRNIGPDRIGTFPVLPAQNPPGIPAGETLTQLDHKTLFLGLAGKIGRKGSFTGAGDPEIDIQLQRVLGVSGFI